MDHVDALEHHCRTTGAVTTATFLLHTASPAFAARHRRHLNAELARTRIDFAVTVLPASVERLLARRGR